MASPTAEPHVRLVHLSKRFSGGAAAVDNVSLDIPRSSFTTLLGPSGCGKTTTLRMIAGFYEPDGGDIFIGPRRVNDVPVHRRGTAMVFQDYALFPHMSVEENVGYGLRLAHVSRSTLRTRVAETLEFLGLSGLERRSPGQLSGGQQQRVALARTLVLNPEVLLLDEPLSNLDAKLRISIRSELISIQRQLGITTIYVTHDQDEALAMSDWVAVMNHGRVVQWGTPWDVYYRPRTPFMADFLGSVNLIPATVLGIDGHGMAVNLEGQRLVLRRVGDSSQSDGAARAEGRGVDADGPVPYQPGRHLARPVPGDQVLLSIRPETLTLGVERSEGCVALDGQVIGRTFLGQLMRYTVRIGQHDWLVDQPDPGSAGLAEGAVRVLVNLRRVHVIPEPDAVE